MSSTLYNRGTTTQTGVRRRAEAVDKSITDLRAAIAAVGDTERVLRVLEARVAGLERKVSTLETANASLEERLAAQQAPAPTPVLEVQDATATST
jgi:hypothetical protein